MRILGIDPGSRFTGYGIIERADGRLRHVASGRINASCVDDFAARLDVIYRGLCDVLQEHPCEAAAIESLFTARNALSTIKLGHARGVALLALQHNALAYGEYPPATIKLAVTGSGRADKETVQLMVARLLGLRGEISSDAADALAIAITHAQSLDVARRLEPSIA